MKDKNDPGTIDFLGEKGKRGQPRRYGSNAERQKAYRERKKAQGLREVTSRTWVKERPRKAPVEIVTSRVLVIDTGVGSVVRALRAKG